MGFEPKIPVFEQLKTEHSTGVAAAVIGLNFFLEYNFDFLMCFQIFELCRFLELPVNCIAILSYILVTRHTSKHISIVAANRTSVLFFMVFVFPPNKSTLLV
jgi:hypothetical protein